jgi:hypothetical protein
MLDFDAGDGLFRSLVIEACGLKPFINVLHVGCCMILFLLLLLVYFTSHCFPPSAISILLFLYTFLHFPVLAVFRLFIISSGGYLEHNHDSKVIRGASDPGIFRGWKTTRTKVKSATSFRIQYS